MKLQTEGRQTERNTWLDHLGFEGPIQPGTHARSDPTGEFPTGPAVGARIGIPQRLRHLQGFIGDRSRRILATQDAPSASD